MPGRVILLRASRLRGSPKVLKRQIRIRFRLVRSKRKREWLLKSRSIRELEITRVTLSFYRDSGVKVKTKIEKLRLILTSNNT